ncbi:MAG: DUF1614 domain-containing protein [Methanoregula sp.]
MSDGVHFYSAGPLSVLGIIIVIGLIVLIIPLLFLGLIGEAFTRLGFSWIAAVAVVLLMLLGSFINIPLWKIRRDTVRISHEEGMSMTNVDTAWADTPVWDTIISLNFGGAVIPVTLSLYFLYRALLVSNSSLAEYVIAGILIVAAVAYVTTRPLTGVGIRTSLFIPGLTALLVGFFLSGQIGLSAGVIAFVSGVFGTLLGANIAHLPAAKKLEVPQISIGGAGTFGAVFISCILSALIA